MQGSSIVLFHLWFWQVTRHPVEQISFTEVTVHAIMKLPAFYAAGAVHLCRIAASTGAS
jgi:hypothetical protein